MNVLMFVCVGPLILIAMIFACVSMAQRKGFGESHWAFSGPIGLVALFVLRPARGGDSEETAKLRKHRANSLGVWITLGSLALLVAAFCFWRSVLMKELPL